MPPKNGRKASFLAAAEVPKGFTLADLESVMVGHLVMHKARYEDIQKLTGLSRATVARRLQHAKNRGWLAYRLELKVPRGLRESYQAQVRDVYLESKLRELLSKYGVRSIVVVERKRISKDDPHGITKRVAKAAAERLSAVLRGRPGVVGVNWGYSTRWTVEAMEQTDRQHPKLVFVPLIGDLSIDQSQKREFEEASLCSGNRLALCASEKLCAPPPIVLTTPAFISRAFADDDKKLETIWEFIEEDISYRRIFGKGHHRGERSGETALIDRMDTIITGMSDLHRLSALVSMAKVIREEDLVKLKAAGYIGDLGGHVIHDPDTEITDEEARDLARRISELVVSPKPEDFVRVAERARRRSDNKTGVFVISRRSEKAPALIAACKMGAINELFTDSATAAEMLRLIES